MHTHSNPHSQMATSPDYPLSLLVAAITLPANQPDPHLSLTNPRNLTPTVSRSAPSRLPGSTQISTMCPPAAGGTGLIFTMSPQTVERMCPIFMTSPQMLNFTTFPLTVETVLKCTMSHPIAMKRLVFIVYLQLEWPTVLLAMPITRLRPRLMVTHTQSRPQTVLRNPTALSPLTLTRSQRCLLLTLSVATLISPLQSYLTEHLSRCNLCVTIATTLDNYVHTHRA